MRSCRVVGCHTPPQVKRTLGWYCDDHDPMRLALAAAATGVADIDFTDALDQVPAVPTAIRLDPPAEELFYTTMRGLMRGDITLDDLRIMVPS